MRLDQKISLTAFPPDHAFKAYKVGCYFEATAVLHGYLESQMKSLFHLYAIKNSQTQLSETWDVSEKMSYIMLSHTLFILNIINKKEYHVLVNFNTLRNTLMHRFYLDPYEGTNKGVSIKKFESCFVPAYNLLYQLMEKADELV